MFTAETDSMVIVVCANIIIHEMKHRINSEIIIIMTIYLTAMNTYERSFSEKQ